MQALHVDVYLVGDASREEFRDGCAVLDALSRVHRFADIESAVDGLNNTQDEHAFAPLIVLAQSHPGQFTSDGVDCLRTAAPLARIVALLGMWCEGEPRSGHPLPGVIRVYWHQAVARFPRKLSKWAEGRGSTWALPLTATDEERLLASTTAALPQATGLVALWSRRAEMEGFLAAACRAAGYATAWLHPRQPGGVRGAVAALFDGTSLDAKGLAELRDFAARVAPTRVLALLDFPRIKEVQLAAEMGVRVLAKPVNVEDLLACCRQLANIHSGC